jgi:predicted DNA-binding transcriptional regulator YafY
MTRGPGRAARLTWLSERIRDRPSTAAQLAREASVSKRSIERDLVTLRDELGLQVEVDDQHRYSVVSPSAGLNEVEALAVYSAARLLLHTRIGEAHYRSAMRKLARQVPEPARGTLLRAVDSLQPAPEDRTLDLVAQAWFGRRVLRCAYLSYGREQPERRDLEILFFELNRRNLDPYVIAFDRTKRQKVLVFKLARMSNVHLLDEHYEPPDDFDPVEALGGTFGIVIGEPVWVTVRVSPTAAPRFRELADPGVAIDEEHGDGSLVARVRATLDAEGRALELLPWLLSWGADLTVVAPASVRETVADVLSRAAEGYRR